MKIKITINTDSNQEKIKIWKIIKKELSEIFEELKQDIIYWTNVIKFLED